MSSETPSQRNLRMGLGLFSFALALAFGFVVVRVVGASVLAIPGVMSSY